MVANVADWIKNYFGLTLRVENDRHAAWHKGTSRCCTKRYGKSLIGIRPYLILIILFLNPVRISLRIIETRANNTHSEGLKLSVEVAEPATLTRSARRPSKGKEPENRGLSNKV